MLTWPRVTHRWFLQIVKMAGDKAGAVGVGVVPQQLLSTCWAPTLNWVPEAETWAQTLKELTWHQYQPTAHTGPLHSHHTLYTMLKRLMALLPLPSDCELIRAHHLSRPTCYGIPCSPLLS